MPGPLHGIRVLEFGQIVAGPVAATALADLGADVVKVEPLHGEERRNTGAVIPNEGKYFQSLNRGKRSLSIDLARPEGQAAIHRIVPMFDVVLINYRFGVPERLGIDYESLRALRADLIYATITGFGDRGDWAARGGSDIVAQAYSGVMAAEGSVDEFGAPAPVGVSPVIDRTSALATAMGICAALYHRQLTGEGQEIRSSLLQSGLELVTRYAMREPVHDATGRDPLMAEINRRRAAGAPYDELVNFRKGQGIRFAAHRLYYRGYHTKEGALVLGALTRLNRDGIRRVLDMHDTADTPDFDAADPESDRLINEWHSEIQQKLMEHTANEWVEIFVTAGVPASVVHFPEEMADDPQVNVMEMMTEQVHPVTGPQRVVGPLIRMSATPTSVLRPAPGLGWHTREVLGEAGFTTDEIEALVADGVVRTD
jgi:crotonobetainyl-CoA:carnitine CoA-transferase CaiB-like acyl-CoA transferase